MADVKKKTIDTWKTKTWYHVLAPKLFNEAEIAQVPAQDDEHIINRIIKIPLKEITRDLSHIYTNIKLRVETVKGKTAYTKFIGHLIAREYIQTLGRKGRRLLYRVQVVKSKDDVDFTVKILIVTNGPASAPKCTILRNASKEWLSEKTKTTDFAQFIQDVLYGKAGLELQGKLKKIYPIKRVEIYKTELTEVFDVEENIQADVASAKSEKQKEDANETEEETQPNVA